VQLERFGRKERAARGGFQISEATQQRKEIGAKRLLTGQGMIWNPFQRTRGRRGTMGRLQMRKEIRVGDGRRSVKN